MARLISEAVENNSLPLLLLYGGKEFGESLKSRLKDGLQIVSLGSHRTVNGTEKIIDVKNLKYFGQIKERFSYCLFFIENTEDKKVLSEALPKLQVDKAKTIIFVSPRKIEEYFDILLSVKKIGHIKVVILGDLFDPMLRSKEFFFSNLLKKISTNKTVSFTGNDLQPIFPISLEDALNGVEQCLYTQSLKSGIFLLYYENPQTLLSAVHVLRRIEPELKLAFDRETETLPESKTHQQIIEEICQKTLITPLYISLPNNFESQISKFFNIHSNNNRMVKSKEKVKEKRRIKFKVSTGVWGKALLIAVPTYFLMSLICIFVGTFFLYTSVKEMKKGEFEYALKYTKAASIFLTFGEPSLNLLTTVSHSVPNESVTTFLKRVSDGQTAAEILSNEIVPVIENASSGISKGNLENLISGSIYLYFLLEKHQSIKGELSVNGSGKLNYLHTLTTLPSILGYHTPKTYLVLFQNNGELRPSGGFIGSIAEIKFKNGKIMDYELMDVYQPDGQLKNHIEPHYIIRRHLQPHLYLRDSSFDLDFQDTASKAALLYDLETGHKVDGVISVDFEVLRSIIEIAGPVTLHKYNKTIDSNTAFSFLQDTIESNFFPGSKAKKEVLDALLSNILLKLEEDKGLRTKLLKRIPDLLSQKHIMFAFREQSIQKTFNLNGLGGTLHDFRTNRDNEVRDVLGINEANIGVNKANVNVTRKVSYLPSIADQRLNGTVNITYSNSGGKDYTTYLRIITPKNSRLVNILQNGKLEKTTQAVTNPSVYERKGFKAPSELEVDTSEYNKYTTLGFVTTIPKQSTKTISVSYQNGLRIVPLEEIKYSLLFIKQPGTIPYKINLILSYPNDLSPKNISGGVLKNNTVEFVKEVTTDTVFNAEFGQ